jgi:hypothetical protein
VENSRDMLYLYLSHTEMQLGQTAEDIHTVDSCLLSSLAYFKITMFVLLGVVQVSLCLMVSIAY